MADNKFSEEKQLARCEPMSRLQSYIAGKWKILILWYISFYKVQRFGELMRRLDGITQSTLTKQLRELEQDGFIHRKIYVQNAVRNPRSYCRKRHLYQQGHNNSIFPANIPHEVNAGENGLYLFAKFIPALC